MWIVLYFKNEKSFKKKLGKISLRKNSTRCSDNSIDEVYKSAVQTLCHLQNLLRSPIFRGSIQLKLKVHGKTRADLSNLFKGVEDAIQGLAYENDRQVKQGMFSSS